MTTQTNSESQAHAKLESIVAMVKRLEHAEECENGYKHFTPCTLWMEWTESDMDFDSFHDADAAREAIEESALSVEVRSGWVTLEGWLALRDNSAWEQAAEYKILLCWGGPAVRIVGELDEHGEPETARLEHQDWGKAWTELNLGGVDIAKGSYAEWESRVSNRPHSLLTYARVFYYGS